MEYLLWNGWCTSCLPVCILSFEKLEAGFTHSAEAERLEVQFKICQSPVMKSWCASYRVPRIFMHDIHDMTKFMELELLLQTICRKTHHPEPSWNWVYKIGTADCTACLPKMGKSSQQCYFRGAINARKQHNKWKPGNGSRRVTKAGLTAMCRSTRVSPSLQHDILHHHVTDLRR